jgi:meso-butanediol dehydrogenase / (S,S)-butanediol dehydrogenase / diacetyl reductase
MLQGKTMLVTGATSGIGAAIAEAAAAAGAKLLLNGRSENRGDAIRRACGPDTVFVASDLAEPGAADRLVGAALAAFGRLDVLVNNAGIIYRGTVDTTTDEEWARTMAVNVTGVFAMCRAAVRHMKRQGHGTIVNIGSDWALVGGVNAFAYCASKGAVAQMTRAMAIDHARDGIRVNCVCPGDIDTPMLASMFEADGISHAEGLAQLGAGIPMGRVGRPEEIAKATVFLASDASSYMTGAMLSVDGGITAA